MKKKVIGILTILSSLTACLTIVFTFLTTYNFFYISDIFSSYLGVQIVLAITMFIWAIRFWILESGRRKYFYSGFCILISIIFIFFMKIFIR